jgi:hypothetical protein
MEIEQELTRGDVTAVYRRATVMKDRSNTIDGKSFRNPKFSDFLPHIEYLSLAGAHNVTDRGDNAGFFTEDGKGLEIYRRKKERESCLEEITEVIKKHNGGQSKDDKEERGKLLEEIFGTRAWSRIEGLKLDVLQDGRNKLWVKLEGVPYAFTPPDPEAVTPPADV